jgi:multiple sugar transport system permease protein
VPVTYLRDNNLSTVPRGLKVILGQFGQGGSIPHVVIFFLGQRHFVEGIATTGRKG